MASFTHISVEEAKSMVNEGKALAIDIRQPEKYQEARLPGAKHLSRAELDSFTETMDKEQPLIVYCNRGNSSQTVAQHLVEVGFNQVYSMDGGFTAWESIYPED